MERQEVYGLTVPQLETWCQKQGLPAYRGRQIAVWLYARRVTDWVAMTDLPKPLRSRWSEDFPIVPPGIDAVRTSADGTQKLRVALQDGEAVETVIMPMKEAEGDRAERITACISTQVGCALGCTFCATATLGLRRQLTAGEIVAQVTLAQDRIAPRRLTNLVLMGMGEPLHNFDAVVQALRVLTGEPGPGLGPKRVTVSTVGLVPEIGKLADTGLGVRLAVSLNATSDNARNQTMPVNRRYPLAALMQAARGYAEATGLRVTFEYVVMAGENDTDEDARRLARLVRGIPCKINLIPYNTNTGSEYRRPAQARLERFRDLLYPHCPAVTVRYSRGLDIEAACGQLVASKVPSPAG